MEKKKENEFPNEILGFNIELEAGDLLMKPLEHLRINLLKEVMEYFAFEFGDTKNKLGTTFTAGTAKYTLVERTTDGHLIFMSSERHKLTTESGNSLSWEQNISKLEKKS